MAPAWGLRPVAHLQGHTDKDAQNDSTLQQQKQAQIQMQTHICLRKAWIWRNQHMHWWLGDFPLSSAGGLAACALREKNYYKVRLHEDAEKYTRGFG